jgi:HD-like signal output (HDOD) protein/signal transduction histidine kinase
MELVRLPSPPHILSQLLDVCHDPESSTADLANLISVDAALTSKLFMAVNSTAFAIREPVDSLEQAITLIGHDLVKTMAITSSIQQLFAGLINTQKEFVCNLWLDSLYCAVFARDIAIARDYEYPQDAYLAGLFHDFGQIIFDARFHEQYIKIINSDTEAETIAKENSQYGVSHTELGASILEQWPSLNPGIADAVRFHHEEEEQLLGCDMLCQIVAEASQLARHWSHEGKADATWHSRLVGDEDLKNIYMHVKDSVTLTAKKIGISLPRSRCLTQEHLSRDIEKETIKLARKIRNASLSRVINPEHQFSAAPESPRALLDKIAREMQFFFSISDVGLLLRDPQDGGLLCLYQISHAVPVSKFSVENNNSQLTRSFVERSQLWIEPEIPDYKKSPISDRQIIRRLNHDIALSFPLRHEKNTLGTVVIGCHKTQKNNLEKLSDVISSYLENVAETWSIANQEAEELPPEESVQNDIDKLIHEISNPLSVIGNYIDILKVNAQEEGAENNKEIEILQEELQRIRNIVWNFKDEKYAGAQAVHLNAELENCIPLYVKSTCGGKEVQIMWSLDSTEAEIQITQDAFRQIVLNLVKNAVEAQTSDAAIMVASHHFANLDGRLYAQFSISDRGGGIDEKTLRNLFTPLTSDKQGAGRGLGLSVVAEILKSFDGQIKYMENEVGGALFEILIPLADNQQAGEL